MFKNHIPYRGILGKITKATQDREQRALLFSLNVAVPKEAKDPENPLNIFRTELPVVLRPFRHGAEHIGDPEHRFVVVCQNLGAFAHIAVLSRSNALLSISIARGKRMLFSRWICRCRSSSNRRRLS